MESIQHIAENENKRLIYSEEFKSLIKNNPGLIKSFRNFERLLIEKRGNEDLFFDSVFEEGDMRITVIDKHRRNQTVIPGSYLKVEIKSEIFFVKRKGGFWDRDEGLGFNEFNSLIKAREVLKDIEGVEVVDFQLGYQDEEKRISYFVSKWIDGASMDDYIAGLRIKNTGYFEDKNIEAQISSLYSRVNKIISKLQSFYDVGIDNMLYDPVSDKILIFDIPYKLILQDRENNDSVKRVLKGI